MTIEAHQQAIRLSPFDPLAFLFAAGLALAHQAAERYEEAIDWADRALLSQPRLAVAMRIKLICLAQFSHTEEARELPTRVLALQPGLTIASWRAAWATSLFSPELLALYVDGLRKAGLPEG